MSTDTLEIPVVDLGDHETDRSAALARAGREIRSALEQVGFFYVTGHGVDPRVVDAAYQAVADFHALPDKLKNTVAIRDDHPRGYLAQGRDITYNADIDEGPRRASVNESFNLDLEERGRNQWPAEAPWFRTAALAYLDSVHGLANRLLEAFEVALDLEPGFLTSRFADPVLSLRLTRYAALPPEHRGEWSLAPHTDGTFMAVLPANNVRGLWVRPAGRDWIEAPNVPGAFLVNSGDMLRRWSNDRLLSTVHRVANHQEGYRYAMPFFLGPGEDVVIEPIGSFIDADHPSLYEPITAGDMARAFMQRNRVATNAL